MSIIDRRHTLWLLEKDLDDDIKNELVEMKSNSKLKEDAFYKELQFGTSGIRGVMGAGTNRLNTPMLHKLTQALANYLLNMKKNPKVAICYDTRKKSDQFANATADVFAGNKITTYLTTERMPLSLLSYTIREMELDFGIMITASHNPKEYNGYKVYDNTGKQILEKQVEDIKKYIDKVDFFTDIKIATDTATIQKFKKEIPKEVVSKYKETIFAECKKYEGNKEDIKIVYTPLNGVGKNFIPEVLNEMGFANVHKVEAQELWDGEFESCPKPNPELPEVYEKAKEVAVSVDADLILANDPDADRIGMAIKVADEYRILNGNEMAALFLNYMIEIRKEKGTLPNRPVAVRTVVTTPIIDEIITSVGGEARYTLIGFKYIGEKQNQMEDASEIDDFIMGAEEANGYLLTKYLRDKDGVTAAAIGAMMVSHYKAQGKNLIEALDDVYKKHGYFKEKTLNFHFKGKEGETVQKIVMDNLSKKYLKMEFGNPISAFVDYETKSTKMISNEVENNYPRSKKLITLPKSDIVEFLLQDGKVIVRASGTESKLKVYLFAKGDTEEKTLEILSQIEEKTQVAIENLLKLSKEVVAKRNAKVRIDEQLVEKEKRMAEERKAQKNRFKKDFEKPFPEQPTKKLKNEK